MRCVLLSATLDLRQFFATSLAAIADRIDIVADPVADGASEIPLALAWCPAPDAFARYTGLKAVCSIGAGVDSLLACPGLPASVDVVRVIDPDQAQIMSGFVLWHVIGHQRRFSDYAANQSLGLWRRLGQRSPADVPVAVLGYGAIGRRVGADLSRLGFPVLAWSRNASKAPDPGIRHFYGQDGLAALLPQAEIVVNLLPLTLQTRIVLDASLFARMKRGGYLIQLGRGDHLAEDDLLAALDDGTLVGAALDVFSVEPLPPAHPFWRHARIRITPHEASEASGAAVAATLLSTASAIEMGFRPSGAVDRLAGY